MESNSATSDVRVLQVPEVLHGQRLDRVLSSLMPDVSRNRVQRWIDDGRVQLNAAEVRNRRQAVATDDTLRVQPQFEAVIEAQPEAIALDIVHADDDCLVINKPAGLVVHPGAGNASGTLQNALLHFDAALEQIPRAGLVHRLDKNTSGLLLVARTPQAHHLLTQALQAREIHREYQAVVWGRVIAGGEVDAPLARHPTDRTRFHVAGGGRESLTHYRVLSRHVAHSVLKLKLETGRTHQIRVHMQHIGHPLVGDPTYGRRGVGAKGLSTVADEAVAGFRRQALHARRLAFDHPISGERIDLKAALPDDMAALIKALQACPT